MADILLSQLVGIKQHAGAQMTVGKISVTVLVVLVVRSLARYQSGLKVSQTVSPKQVPLTM